MEGKTEHVSWPMLVTGAIITLALALSVHAVMLQGLHVPYPWNFPHTGWARLPDRTLSVLGAIYFSTHVPERMRKLGFGLRCTLLFLLLATIHEDLFRGPFMEFINLSNFTLYPFIDNIPKLLPLAVIAIGVEAWTRRESSFAANLVAAALLASFASLVIAPLADYGFAGVLRATEALEGHQRYGLPYDWHILVPAYFTFAEPVIAALVIGLAIRRQLPRAPITRLAITAALILALKGPVFAPFLNIYFAGTGPLTAILSYAQFTFETMALGIFTAITLQLSIRPARDAQVQI